MRRKTLSSEMKIQFSQVGPGVWIHVRKIAMQAISRNTKKIQIIHRENGIWESSVDVIAGQIPKFNN